MQKSAGKAASLVFVALLAGPTAVVAQQSWDTPNSGGSIASSLPHGGDPWGARKALADKGIVFNLIYTNDILSNLSGGQKRGTIDQGKVEAQFTADLEKLLGWKDFTFYANAFQIHNTGRIRRDYVGSMNTIAAIEAASTTRLSELWLERKFLDGQASFRFGQLAADSEFFFSDLSTMFLQSDWPTIAASNLPGGAPAYPLSTPGVRLKYQPNDAVALLFAVFNGDPAGPCPGDADTCNRYGTNFRLRDPAFMIGEAQFRFNQAKDSGLATTLKLGGWGHLGSFDDRRYATDGTLLANPAGNGMPAQHRGDWGIYTVVDQQLYRPKGGASDSGISTFLRASVSPSDRNLVELEIDAGFTFAGLIPQRPDDRFGVAMIYSRFSESVRAFDQDQINFGNGTFVRDYEANFEFTYVAQIVPGWTVQPVFTYISHPNGEAGRDAKVAGVRSIWKY